MTLLQPMKTKPKWTWRGPDARWRGQKVGAFAVEFPRLVDRRCQRTCKCSERRKRLPDSPALHHTCQLYLVGLKTGFQLELLANEGSSARCGHNDPITKTFNFFEEKGEFKTFAVISKGRYVAMQSKSWAYA